MVLERVKTGVPGLDEIMCGGIPKNELMLVTGTTGTGKTILGMEYLYKGAKKYNDNGVYLSFEEPAEIIKSNVTSFGWDINKLEAEGKFAFIKYDPFRIEDVMDVLDSTVRDIKASRVVIDSISALGLYLKDSAELRRMIFNITLTLRRLNVTPILISEIVYGSSGLSRYGVEEFVTDGVIVLHYERVQSTFNRSIQIWKLRGSEHSEKLHPYKIDKSGITVYPEEEAFTQRKNQ